MSVCIAATATPNGSNMALTWSADASIAGLHHYDVDVSTDHGATWSPVVANVTTTSTSYTTQQGQSYTFRVQGAVVFRETSC